MLVVPAAVVEEMIAHCLDQAPLEACGLLIGSGTMVTSSFPATNADRSARVYTVEPRDLLRADRTAEAAGADLIGVYHSHTHTEAYPSPTDVGAALDPSWHYVLVSLRDLEPALRSYQIRDGVIEEEPVTLE